MTVDLILIVKSVIIISVMNTDKKITFFIQNFQKLEKLTHFRALGLKPINLNT